MTALRAARDGLLYGGAVAAALVLGCLSADACWSQPKPPPVSPGGAGGSVVSGTGGRPAPIVNPEPGPVPAGDPGKCAAAARHADDVCPGKLAATVRTCAKAGGADPQLIPCVMAADGCPALRLCDPVARARAGAGR
ncbi:MAG TPA: hypothetical protein VN962_04310 [Polyangia bacterium]|nr:hypothetical protein [Polyangia bacterium]